MFRRKEEESTTDTTVAEKEVASKDAKDLKDTKDSLKTESAASPAASATSASAAPSSPYSPRPTEQKVAPMNQPTSSYRPAPPPSARPSSFGAAPLGASADEKGKKRILTVGNDILLKGEIATCDRLVIEGAVDAKLNDVHTVEIAETGSFKGSAQIEDAEISGLFEGDLIVRNRLIIYSTGKVRGKITYGEIEIERGGELTGEIKTGGATATASSEKKDDKTKAA